MVKPEKLEIIAPRVVVSKTLPPFLSVDHKFTPSHVIPLGLLLGVLKLEIKSPGFTIRI